MDYGINRHCHHLFILKSSRQHQLYTCTITNSHNNRQQTSGKANVPKWKSTAKQIINVVGGGGPGCRISSVFPHESLINPYCYTDLVRWSPYTCHKLLFGAWSWTGMSYCMSRSGMVSCFTSRCMITSNLCIFVGGFVTLYSPLPWFLLSNSLLMKLPFLCMRRNA